MPDDQIPAPTFVPAAVLPAYARLLEVELHDDGPRAGATSGTPVEASRILYQDAHCEIGVWSCTPGAFPSKRDGIGEQMLILAGEGSIVNADGTTVELRAGVSFVLPDGWKGSWEIRETLYKQYVIWQTSELTMAG